MNQLKRPENSNRGNNDIASIYGRKMTLYTCFNYEERYTGTGMENWPFWISGPTSMWGIKCLKMAFQLFTYWWDRYMSVYISLYSNTHRTSLPKCSTPRNIFDEVHLLHISREHRKIGLHLYIYDEARQKRNLSFQSRVGCGILLSLHSWIQNILCAVLFPYKELLMNHYLPRNPRGQTLSRGESWKMTSCTVLTPVTKVWLSETSKSTLLQNSRKTSWS